MLDKTIRTFTEESASKAPVPGGGGVSALCGSLAASLAEMVTNLTAGKKKYAEYEKEIQGIMKRTETLRLLLLECIEKAGSNLVSVGGASKGCKVCAVGQETDFYQHCRHGGFPQYKERILRHSAVGRDRAALHFISHQLGKFKALFQVGVLHQLKEYK